MIPVKPESHSDILRATQILLVELMTAEIGAWQPVSPKLQERPAQVEFILERILKGALAEKPGDKVKAQIRQFGIIGSRIFAVPGPWSGRELTPGSRFVTFSSSGLRATAEALEEPGCYKVANAEEALPDIELVLRIDAPGRPVADVLALSAGRMASYGALFSQYLVERLPEVLFKNFGAFDSVMRTVEDPKLAPVARYILVTNIYSLVLLMDPAPPDFITRLVGGTLRLLQMPHAAALHDPLLHTYLPNLLGLEGGAKPKPASEVLPRLDQRAHAESVLQRYTGPGTTQTLLQWLKS
jgi:hypothetical protein